MTPEFASREGSTKTLLGTTPEAAGPAERVLIDARALSRRRGDHSLWADLTFSVAAGASLAITVPSGAGSISQNQRRQLLRRTVGHLIQNYGLVESWSVNRNLDVALIGRRVRRDDKADLRRGALDRVGQINNTSFYIAFRTFLMRVSSNG